MSPTPPLPHQFMEVTLKKLLLKMFFSSFLIDHQFASLSFHHVEVISLPHKKTFPAARGSRHRWASTSISMSAISDIRHRHLSSRYRRQICRIEKRYSDIGSVPISTSEFIPISDIEEKKHFT
jgi:hypothetical protein